MAHAKKHRQAEKLLKDADRTASVEEEALHLEMAHVNWTIIYVENCEKEWIRWQKGEDNDSDLITVHALPIGSVEGEHKTDREDSR